MMKKGLALQTRKSILRIKQQVKVKAEHETIHSLKACQAGVVQEGLAQCELALISKFAR